MTAYLSFEWLKLTIRWMPRIIIVLMLGLTVIIFWGQATHGRDQGNLALPRGWLSSLILSSFFAPFFWPVLGGSWAGNEYGWGTIRMVLTRRPYRAQQALAAFLVLLVAVGLALVLVLVTGTAGGLLVSLFTGNDLFTSGALDAGFLGVLVQSFLAAWYVAAFYLLLAYAAATIFRSAAVGIGIGIGATLAQVVVRGIFFELGGTWRTISDHFPILYISALVRRVAAPGFGPGSNMGTIDPSTPGAAESLLAIAILMAVLLAITLVAVQRRDITA
ncbi:MAG: hypothetical protein JOZ41_05800 [Chloroflexi bacterium]|nr:hypothetical protein [Chloroflexota bacterium]